MQTKQFSRLLYHAISKYIRPSFLTILFTKKVLLHEARRQEAYLPCRTSVLIGEWGTPVLARGLRVPLSWLGYSLLWAGLRTGLCTGPRKDLEPEAKGIPWKGPGTRNQGYLSDTLCNYRKCHTEMLTKTKSSIAPVEIMSKIILGRALFN